MKGRAIERERGKEAWTPERPGGVTEDQWTGKLEKASGATEMYGKLGEG